LLRLRSSRSAARRVYPERAAAQISIALHEKELPRASHGPTGVRSLPFEWIASDELMIRARTTESEV
jgi:hypothetical protein